MKSFFKNVLANIVAILLIGGIVIFSFFLFIALSSAFSDNKPTVKTNSILVLDKSFTVIDSPTEDQESLFEISNSNRNLLVREITEAINYAKTDTKIKGISIESDMVNAGITQIDDIRKALEEFKKSGKFVYAYGNTMSQSSYLLSSVADQFFLNPVGGIELRGMSTEVSYFKNFVDKFGIGVEVIRHGKFKAAVEPFLRDDMSPENKEQLSTLLGDIWKETSKKMYTSRKLDSASFNSSVDSLYGMIPNLAMENKLVDQLVQKSEYENILKQKLKISKDEDLHKISIDSYILATSENRSDTDGRIAVLYASGNIMNGEGHQDIYSETMIKEIKKLAADEDVKSVVLRVNSPGGSGNASDEILFELQQLKLKKPLIVSFGDYAASGGYYISMAAEKIFSEPNTITGSIGVFGMIPNAKGLANRNGITAHSVSTNANSNMVSIINGLSPGTVQILTKSVEGTYKRFVHFVTQNRKMNYEQVDQLGGGRVWSGSRAKALGLVDELGSLSDAIAYAKKRGGLSQDAGVEEYPKKRSRFEQFFEDANSNEISTKILKSKLGKENYSFFEKIIDPKNKSQVYMQLPFVVRFE